MNVFCFEFQELSFGLYFCRIKELGGGAILDFGSYGIDVLQWIFQEDPQRIKATKSILNDDGVDTDVTAEFYYGCDRKATLKLSVNEALKNVIKIVGTRHSMEVMRAISGRRWV